MLMVHEDLLVFIKYLQLTTFLTLMVFQEYCFINLNKLHYTYENTWFIISFFVSLVIFYNKYT